MFGERLRRQHDEEDVREERDGVDAVRQRADVAAARARRQPSRLDRVGDVADENRDRRRRQDAPVDELGRKAEHAAAQRVDQQKLDEVVDGEPEETVDVAANDPPHAREHSSSHGACSIARADERFTHRDGPSTAASHPGAGHLPDDEALALAVWPRHDVAPALGYEGRQRNRHAGGVDHARVGDVCKRHLPVAALPDLNGRQPADIHGALDLNDARAKTRRRLHLSGGGLCPP